MRYVLALLLVFTAANSIADIPPPPPCSGLTLLPSQVHITYHGLSSGCSEQGGSCITGETVVFTAFTTFCPLDYIWHFPDGDVVGATTTSRVFSAVGPATVRLTAISFVSPSVDVQTTLNIVSPSAIPLSRPWFAIALLLLLAGIAFIRIG